MYECCKPDGQVVAQPGGLIDHQHGVNAGIYFGVILRILRHTEQSVDLGEYARQGAAFTQQFKENGWSGFAQRVPQFRPGALRNQCIHFSVVDHYLHQVPGFRCDTEAEARLETGNTKHSDRIFGERRRHVSENLVFEVRFSVERVDESTVGGLCNGVYGQIPA